MIQAVIGGKLPRCYENSEDILTSTIFGTLRYLKPDTLLIPFIESAFLYNKKRTTLGEALERIGIRLENYKKVDYIFWTNNLNYGEPDLILIFKDHNQSLKDLLLIIEVKFKSGKSGLDDKDQLVRYFEAVNYDIENFTDPSVSNFKGLKGYIIYLTANKAHLEIDDSSKIIEERYNVKDKIFHLRWQDLYKILEGKQGDCLQYEKAIINDLLLYMDRLGLWDYKGISLPGKSLNFATSQQYPVFYNHEDMSGKSNTYFDSLDKLDFAIGENIFFKEN